MDLLTLELSEFYEHWFRRYRKHKARSLWTYSNIHLPELYARCGHAFFNAHERVGAAPSPLSPSESGPCLDNPNKIEVVYLGDSMLERLKTTGQNTRLARFAREGTAWNAGCGGDRIENMLYRLCLGMFDTLKAYHSREQLHPLNEPPAAAQQNATAAKGIKLWILAAGTNNVRAISYNKGGMPSRPPLHDDSVTSFRVLLISCLRMAPTSRILVLSLTYRTDISDPFIKQANQILEKTVRDVNDEIRDGEGGPDKVTWVEMREEVMYYMLEDHVHWNEEGYRFVDDTIWPYVVDTLSPQEEQNDGNANHTKDGNETANDGPVQHAHEVGTEEDGAMLNAGPNVGMGGTVDAEN